MKATSTLLLLLLISLESCSQAMQNEKSVGGPCEGCEAVFEYGSQMLTWIDTLSDFYEPGPKLAVSGTIYQRDGRTPARDVILYIYHTDQAGKYAIRGDETGWAKKHGYIRGWIKTGDDGRYLFYTLKPGAYPGGGNPAHIHPVIKEPGIAPYWIDEFLFEGDPFITEAERRRLPKRGGSGILNIISTRDGMLTVTRDIILGLNVPGYE